MQTFQRVLPPRMEEELIKLIERTYSHVLYHPPASEEGALICPWTEACERVRLAFLALDLTIGEGVDLDGIFESVRFRFKQ